MNRKTGWHNKSYAISGPRPAMIPKRLRAETIPGAAKAPVAATVQEAYWFATT
jgi:hypothetical protein